MATLPDGSITYLDGTAAKKGVANSCKKLRGRYDSSLFQKVQNDAKINACPAAWLSDAILSEVGGFCTGIVKLVPFCTEISQKARSLSVFRCSFPDRKSDALGVPTSKRRKICKRTPFEGALRGLVSLAAIPRRIHRISSELRS